MGGDNSSNTAADGETSSAATPKTFLCGTCSRVFTKAEHLSRHTRSHLKQKPFTCSKCGKRFGRQDVLTRHQKLHNNERDPTPNPWPASSPLSETPTASSVGSFDNGYRLPKYTNPPIVQLGMENPQPWGNSEDMLEFLLSDFNTSWPLSLPVIQFSPHLNPASPALNQQTGPGHFAMHQMSKLIANLSASLTAEIESTGITSTFLDTCMHVFFEKFIPSFPVLHRPSFLVRESSHPLLLNIIALGSLFVGAKDALLKGEALWKLAHTAVATSWQALITTKGPRDECNGVQLVLTALLGQTYAILSKNGSLRMTSEVFHGLGFYWARQCGMYDIQDFTQADIPAVDAPENEKMEAWKRWAARETTKRSILGHYILDGQISEFSGHPACARHVTNSLPTPAPESVFAANTVDQWIFEMNSHIGFRVTFREVFVSLFSDIQSSQPYLEQTLSNLSVRVVLEGLQSLGSEIQTSGPSVGTPSKMEVARALMKLQSERLLFTDTSVENMELLVRFHAICLNLATPSTSLCQKLCGLYGIQQHLHCQAPVADSISTIQTWCQSVDGLRALLHAMAVQALVEKLPLGRSHVIHLPAAVFAVATIYSARCLAGLPIVSAPKNISWQDVWSLSDSPDGDISSFFRSEPAELREVSTRNLMYDLNSLQITLSSISSRWGVSHAMDDILHRWITIINESNHQAI